MKTEQELADEIQALIQEANRSGCSFKYFVAIKNQANDEDGIVSNMTPKFLVLLLKKFASNLEEQFGFRN